MPALPRSWPLQSKLLSEIDHGEARTRRFAALILAIDAGAQQRLRLVLDGEDTIADGGAVLQRDLLKAACALGAYIVVMRGLAANDATERDIAVEAAADVVAAPLDGDADRRRDLESPGHREALIAGAPGVECLDRAAGELLGYIRVVRRLAHHDMRGIGHRSSLPRGLNDRPF